MNNNRDFKGIWIPKEIWNNEELNWPLKLLLVEIESLDNEDGCFASNQYFADFFKLSKDRISKMVTELKRKEYISVQIVYKEGTQKVEKRIIRVDKMKFHGIGENAVRVSAEMPRGYRRKRLEGIGENAEYNNTINNTINNTNNISSSTQTQQTDNPDIIFFWEDNGGGTVSGYVQETFFHWVDDFDEHGDGMKIVHLAMKMCKKASAMNMNYFEKIMHAWTNQKFTKYDDIVAHEKSRKEQQAARMNNRGNYYGQNNQSYEMTPDFIKNMKKDGAEAKENTTQPTDINKQLEIKKNLAEFRGQEFDFEAEKKKLQEELKEFWDDNKKQGAM